ncbi:choice-of-anchor D domain-containing protein [Chiayiivirga flava]|uniref:Putative repeat protein (TIGR01451 family) n=1 Tax=Chiayiivirga flava TaxID=659595 RepID=A0A7W8D8N3_9GAMM|nr:choice-of-anchor D domain-containing protein [Chiayiivirga flava]MBB5208817.1 putative repeat protein (TIGR01451 family) [Chiayiivirga flava]
MTYFPVASLMLAAAIVAMPVHAVAPERDTDGARVAAQMQPATAIKASALQQMAVLRSIKANKSATQRKIDSRLFLGILNARDDQRARALPDFRFVRPDSDGRVEVEVILSGTTGMKRLLTELQNVDAQVSWRSSARTHLLARMPLQAVERIAALTDVRRVRLPVPAMTNAINTSEGDLTHGAEAARNVYGVSGAGVKVCVLSDGVDSLATLQGSDDLPAVDVLPGQAGSGDEGSAMLEIIHDLAPNAELGFATALPNEAQFAQNILDLAADGCNIIVDDIIYLAESPFQDGPIAQAVNTVTAGGVLYFSSAGNEGNKDDNTSGTWEGDFVPNGTPPALAGAGPVHNFGDGGQSILIEAGSSGTPAILIWAEHYDATTGLASTDYDLYDMNAALTTVFDASTDTQDGAGGDDFPIEFIGGGAFAGERLVVAQFAAGATSSTPMFNLILFRGELDDALSTGGTTRGHSAAAEAYSVAATPAAASLDGVSGDGPFPGLFTTADTSESFSADGPRRIILDPAGVELTPGNRTSTGGVVRQKPDVTAADGVATAAPGFNPFYGTSAAAPHAAAIAALLKQGDPAATPAQIRAALISTALDIEVPGVDRTTGAGIVMPAPALQTLGVAPAAFLAEGAVVSTQIVGDGDAFIEGNEDWSLVIPLENVGGATATDISATLSSATPGVTVLSGVSTYPDLAAAASAPNATAYTFYVDPSVTCGGSIEFTLDVTYTGGGAPSQTFVHSFQAGAPGAPVTLSYAGAPVVIPDGADLTGTAPGAAVDAAIAVADAGSVYRIAMSIDGDTCNANVGSTTVGLDHTFVNDLQLTLLSPAGTAVLAINNTDGSGNNFCQTVLDEDGGGVNIQTVLTANAPFTGSFVPNASFVPFRGEDMTGNWTLRAQDFFSGDTGNIRAWSVTVTPAICDAPAQTVQLAATKTVAGTFEEGGAVTYTVEITNTGTGLQPDNIGDEFTDTLPAGLTLGTPTATDGTVSAAGVNPVTWNGSLLPGATVTITIPATIDAGTAGMSIDNQATVNFDTDRDGSNESNALSDDPGTGAPNDATAFVVLQGELSIAPAAIAFGDVVVGDTSAAQAVTLENIGDAPLNVTSIDAAAAPFAPDGSGDCPVAPFPLAAGASCTLAYTFSPAVTGPAAASIAVAADVPGGGTIDLSGNGTQGNLTIAPALVDFGNVAVGATSVASVVTLFNDGTASLEVTAIDAATAPFALDAGSTCAAVPFTLAPGTGCDLAYTFGPVAAGAAADTIAVTADAPGAGSFDLSGVGTLGELTVAPAVLDFGDIPVGNSSASEMVTLTNTGDAALQVVSFATASAPFEQLAFGSCPGSLPFALAPGESCTVFYRFQPTAAGLASEAIAIGDDNGGSAGFTLRGTGLLGQLAVAPLALDFGDIEVGDTSAPQEITLSNPGNAATSINGISGPTPPFARTGGGTCPAGAFSLAAGDSCTAQFTFSPTASGAANQSVTVIAADVDIPSIDVSLSGTGFTVGAVLSGAIDFGEVGVGEGGAVTEQGVSITNTGGVPVEVTAFGEATAPFYYAGTTCAALPFTLQPGEFCIVGYGFSPTDAGEFSQTLTFVTEFGDLDVTLNGVGTGGGTVTPPTPQPLHIPTLSALGLLLTASLLALLGLLGIRRQF